MVDKMDNFELAAPLDLSHHYSDITRNRKPSAIKGFYKYFTIPGIGNLAGGQFVRNLRGRHRLTIRCRSS